MVAELESMGVSVMVSVWPTVNVERGDLRRDGSPWPAAVRRARPAGHMLFTDAQPGGRPGENRLPPFLRRNASRSPRASSGSGRATATIATASRSSGWTRASQRPTRPTMQTSAIISGTGCRSPACIRCCTSRLSTTGSRRKASERRQPLPLCLGRQPAVRRCGLVGRHPIDVRGAPEIGAPLG